MKILFGIQATGNGHISRSIELYNLLSQHRGIEKLDVLISGNNSNIDIPFPVQYQFKGLTFSYGKGGRISLWGTFRKTSWWSFWKAIFSVPFKKYDLIISDFEPITLWGARIFRVSSVGLGNMYSMQSKKFPKMGWSARLTKYSTLLLCPAKKKVAMHFHKFDDFVFNPIIRPEILNATPTDENFVLVYLISYTDEELIQMFQELCLCKYRFILYSKVATHTYQNENVTVKPINSQTFTQDIIRCSGVITAGGFQTAAEALHLGKKLFVIPIRKQVEQIANAKILRQMGVFTSKKPDPFLIKYWLENAVPLKIHYESELSEMMQYILSQGKAA
ncbi:MAG: hypothetical protein NZ522_04365 [Chitinophagales bacterium]|nr:hypothetical protein [Chitinophagales bacterium]